jgi:hypothetical protein
VTLTSALAAMLICTGCVSPQAAGGEHDVFPASGGTTSVMTSNTDEINDLGMYPLPNLAGSSIRIESVTIASPPPGMRTLNVRAYDYDQTKNVVIGGAGDLPTECPRQYKPHPIDSFITPPHAKKPSWFVVIEFTISKPGRYSLRRLRIDYTVDGRPGWQYFDVDTTVVIHGPPKPGPTPEPSSAVCDF